MSVGKTTSQNRQEGLYLLGQMGEGSPPQVFWSTSWKPAGHVHSKPILRSVQIWEQPPLLCRHSFSPGGGEGGHRLLNSSGRQGSGPEQSQALEQQTPTEPGRQEAALNLSLISQVTGKEEDQRAGP